MENKNKSEKGAVWSRTNDKNVEYLAIKIDINGETHYFKGFLNSGWDEEQNAGRPKFILFESQNKPYHLSERSKKLD